MRQLLLPGELAAGQQVVIRGGDHHYLADVLRLKPGDIVAVLDESGVHWTATLLTVDRSQVVLTISADRDNPTPARSAESGARSNAGVPLRFPAITVYQAIPRGRKLDESIRSLVQAGVTSVRPVITERTVVRPAEGSGRVERWRRIAREAVQQSGAELPTEIRDPVPLCEVSASSGALSLVLHTEPLAQSSLHRYLGETPDAIELVVGPEGGFTTDELGGLVAGGFSPLWLGPQVLRSETAALFVAAAVRVVILERDQWQPVTT